MATAKGNKNMESEKKIIKGRLSVIKRFLKLVEEQPTTEQLDYSVYSVRMLTSVIDYLIEETSNTLDLLIKILSEAKYLILSLKSNDNDNHFKLLCAIAKVELAICLL